MGILGAGPGLGEVLGRLRSGGPRDAARRAVARLYRRLGADQLSFPLLAADIADSSNAPLLRAGALAEGQPLRIAWICTPPSAGSGGHTTLFRMVREVERRGHESTLLLYDRHGGDVARHERVIRSSWPKLKSGVQSVPTTLGGFDVAIASAWQTAHVLAARGAAPMHRLYFAQDFEPYFYPRGSLYALAEDSYRLGFRVIALGEMVAQCLERELDVQSDIVQFGCDTDTYGIAGESDRSGVVCYAKPGADRRGLLLARLALEKFHRSHPEHPIHLYGDDPGPWEVPTVRHGRLTPTELSVLYNTVVAGVAMSFTNISLVAEEMLAAGVVPVVNDSPLARADLQNPYAEWASPTVGGIVAALERAVEHSYVESRARAAAASVRTGWSQTAREVADLIEDEAYGRRQDARAAQERTGVQK